MIPSARFRTRSTTSRCCTCCDGSLKGLEVLREIVPKVQVGDVSEVGYRNPVSKPHGRESEDESIKRVSLRPRHAPESTHSRHASQKESGTSNHRVAGPCVAATCAGWQVAGRASFLVRLPRGMPDHRMNWPPDLLASSVYVDEDRAEWDTVR